jgi:hypothetical protein
MARKRKDPSTNLSFDTFLDVITNCIGVLMVITILAIINTKYMTFIVRTPFVRHSDKSPDFSECRNNRNIPINKAAIQDKLKEYVAEIKTNRFDYSRIMQSPVPQLKDVGDKFYQVDFTRLFRENILALIPKTKDTAGIGPADLQFSYILDNIDPQQEFAFFLVRPDSYEVFREARKILWKKNVEVGWEPLSPDQTISFSAKGRKPTIE